MDKLTRRALAYADRYVRGWCQDFEVPEHARDDALQEACVEALKRVRTFDEAKGQMLEEWIRAQMEPRLFRWLKRLHHGGITGTAEAKTPIGVFNAVVEEPQDAEPADDAEKLLAQVDALSAEDRDLLERYYGISGDASTQEQLAAERGVTQQAVAKRIARVLEKIHAPVVVKTGTAGNPYRGDEAQTESPSNSTERAALGGGVTVQPSYLSTEYKHLKQHFRDMCEGQGYPSSAVPKQHGVHDEQTGPGTLSTKCSEWVPDSKFWTPLRRKARMDAAIRYADERRAFRTLNSISEENADATMREQMEGWHEHADSADTQFFLRQAAKAERYCGTVLGTDKEGEDE